MVEYIKRKELDFLNDFHIGNGKYVGLKLDDVFDKLATTDVVERSKIEAAIEEIKTTTSRYAVAKERGGLGHVMWFDYLISEQEVLKILKKHLF